MEYCHFTNFLDQEDALEFMKARKGNIIEQSEAVAYLADTGMKSNDLAKELGIKHYTLRHMARVGKRLTEDVKELVIKSRLSFSHAREVAGFDPSEQSNTAREAIRKRKSVRDLEADRRGYDKRLDEKAKKYFERLANIMSERTSLDVSIEPDGDDKNAGYVKLRYSDLARFDAIADRLGVDVSDT